MGQEPTLPGESSNHVSWPADAFDQLRDFVVVIEAGGTIVYVNPFASEILGLDVAEAIGRSIADYLHPADLVRALRVVTMMVDEAMDVPISPAIYRVRRADGSWLPIEVNASVMASADSDLVAIVGRYSGDRAIQDRIMERLIADESATEVIALVPDFGLWRHPDDHYAVFFTGDDGSRRSVGTSVACALGDVTDDGAPWHLAAVADGEVVATLADFPPALRTAAESAGMAECWAIPVADPLFDRPAVIVAWSRAGGPILEVHRYALQTMAQLLALILRWRLQVAGLRRAAHRDPLTGLPNRAGFWEVLEAGGREPSAGRVGILYVDLDGFKAVNDAHGHRVGDLVLAEVAQRISAVLRPDDVVARLGGDEFAVLCPQLDDDSSASSIADRVVSSLRQPFFVGEVEVAIGASVGIATALSGQLTADDLIDAADRALYLAKDGGRDRWHLSSEPAPRGPLRSRS
jgi:diguanylate cyclase (GGDEF)-like protein/PAS domain S-box-containing protein